MIKNDYYYIAMNDLLYLQSTLSFPGYNQIAVQCQQIVEKLLKSMVTYACTVNIEENLRTHNLKKIYYRLHSEIPSILLDPKDLAYLNDFYFDAKYPGDDFITVNKESCILCLQVLYDVLAVTTDFRKKLKLETLEYDITMLP